MTRTFGSDNAIAWVQIRLRGGVSKLISTTMWYAVVVFLAMMGSVQFLPEDSSRVLTGWTMGLLGLQGAILLLLAPIRIAGAIGQDIKTGIIESHRLMPIASVQAIAGYILGSVTTAMCLATANLVLGGVAAAQSGIAGGNWLEANALLLSFAVFVWVAVACAAFHQRNPIAVLFVAPVIPAIGQSGAIGALPGVTLLVTPLLGNSIFDLTATIGSLREVYVLSMAVQCVLGVLCFVAAARKYRRGDVIGFTPVLGLLLLATWVAASYLGVMWWDDLKPRYLHVRDDWLTPAVQFTASLIGGMLIALIPILTAGEQTVVWVGRRLLNDPALRGRRPVPDAVIVLVATVILMALAIGPIRFSRDGESLGVWPLIGVGVVVLAHLATVSFASRALRFYTSKLNNVLTISLGILWVGPFLADLVRRELIENSIGPVLTEISCISPAGAIVALLNGRALEVSAGLAIQVAIALCAIVVYRQMHPLQRQRRRARALSDSSLKLN